MESQIGRKTVGQSEAVPDSSTRMDSGPSLESSDKIGLPPDPLETQASLEASPSGEWLVVDSTPNTLQTGTEALLHPSSEVFYSNLHQMSIGYPAQSQPEVDISGPLMTTDLFGQQADKKEAFPDTQLLQRTSMLPQ